MKHMFFFFFRRAVHKRNKTNMHETEQTRTIYSHEYIERRLALYCVTVVSRQSSVVVIYSLPRGKAPGSDEDLLAVRNLEEEDCFA